MEPHHLTGGSEAETSQSLVDPPRALTNTPYQLVIICYVSGLKDLLERIS